MIKEFKGYSLWQKEQEDLENKFVHAIEYEYGIIDITTNRQKNNGTRIFELPVRYNRPYRNHKIKLGTYKSGYVRNINGCSSIYQLNKQYTRKYVTTLLENDGKLVDHKSDCMSRALIWNQMARMVYMLEFAKRNYNLKNRKNENRL